MNETEHIEQCMYQASRAIIAESIGVKVACVRVNAEPARAATGAIEFVIEQPTNPLPLLAGPICAQTCKLDTISGNLIERDSTLAIALALELKDGDKDAARDVINRGAVAVAELLDALCEVFTAVSVRLRDDGFITGAEIRSLIAAAATASSGPPEKRAT